MRSRYRRRYGDGATARRGYGHACAADVRSLPALCDIVVFLDGHGSDDASAMLRLTAPVRNGRFDLTTGSRTRGKPEPGSMAPQEILAGRGAALIIALPYRVRYSDRCPFRVIVRRRLDAVGMCQRTFGWNVEMQVLAARDGSRILELPIDHPNRRAGESKVLGRAALRTPPHIATTHAGTVST